MSTKDMLKSELKTAATIALTAVATTLGAPKANAAEAEIDSDAKVEMYAPNASEANARAESTINFEDAAAEYASSAGENWNYRNGHEYALAHGLRRDTRLSRNLERPNRDFAGYAGAYINPNVRPDEVGHIVIIPNDIQRESHHIGYMTRQEAEYWQAQGGRGYSKPREHYGYDYGSGGRVGEVVRDVEHVVRDVDHVVRTIGNIFNGGRRGGR